MPYYIDTFASIWFSYHLSVFTCDKSNLTQKCPLFRSIFRDYFFFFTTKMIKIVLLVVYYVLIDIKLEFLCIPTFNKQTLCLGVRSQRISL